jgi:tetratricopeptide (TPR) repeat protein
MDPSSLRDAARPSGWIPHRRDGSLNGWSAALAGSRICREQNLGRPVDRSGRRIVVRTAITVLVVSPGGMRYQRGMRIAPIVLCLLLPGCASTLDKARVARDEGALDDARGLYERAMKDAQTAPVARQELATMLSEHASRIEESDPEAAAAEYAHALQLDPVNAMALTGTVRLLRGKGELERAEDVLRTAAATGPCGTCNRLSVVILLERADRELRNENWDGAIELYTKAQTLRSQAEPAVSIVNAHVMAGRGDDAVAALQEAQPLMLQADAVTVGEFVRLRQSIVKQALERDEIELADRARAVHLANEPVAQRIELALAVARHLAAEDRMDEALARYEALVDDEAEPPVPDAVRSDVLTRIVNIHANRATGHLHEGRGDDADAALVKALELRPDDWALKLQRILAVCPKTGAQAALAALDQVPKDVVGLADTRAILLSQRALELAEAGDLAAAEESLTRAQELRGDLPEVHLAAAQILSQQPLELDARERKALRGSMSFVRYEAEPRRYAEALAELHWARTASERRSRNSLFVAPWLGEKMHALAARLRTAYPYDVEFRSEPEPRLVLKNTSAAYLEVSLRGIDDGRDLGLPPDGEESLTLADSGLLTLQIGKRKRVFFAEPYTVVTLPVP